MILSSGCSAPGGFSLASVTKSPVQSVTSTTKNAWSKSRNAVAGVFKGDSAKDKAIARNEVKSNVDPLRLDRKTEVGPEVFVANGRLWESTGNRQKAMESYSKALEVQPNDAKALASIARLHHASGNFPKAIEFFQKAILQDPSQSTLHNDLGLTYSKSGNNAAAVASLKTALEIDPGTSRYANNLASVQFDLGESESALKVLMENNKPAVAHYNMAYLYQEKGQSDKARLHLNEAVKYKNEGQIDSSIARAVNRSQDLLAKLGGGKPSALPPTTTIAKSAPLAPKPSEVTIRQTSQSVGKSQPMSVKTAGAKILKGEATSANRQVKANFATARLGTKTVTAAKPAAATPEATTPPASTAADAPKTSGAFVMPPGF